MTEKKYRVHDWVKFQYSEIGEYIDENHTDKPLRNDEIVDLLNALHEENKAYLKEIRRLEDREKQLLDEISDFQELLDKEDKKLMNEFRCRCND